MKVWIVRIVGALLMVGGIFFVPKFDQNDYDERYKKILAIFAIPVGLMILFATFLQIG